MTADLPAQPQSRKKGVKALLPVLVSAGILTYIGINYRVGEIWDKADDLSLATIAAALGLLLANLALGMGRLKYLLSYFGASHVGLFDCVRAHVAGLLSSVFVMNLVGNVVGRFALLRRQGVDVATVTALVFTEKLLLAVTGLGLGLYGFAAVFGSRKLFVGLQDALRMETMPERLECFDISHTMGEATVASCVVFDSNGPLKSDYRRFNIEGITGGDDYAAMEQALRRRYTRLKQGEGLLPDVLVIDGGPGQVSRAHAVLDELQVDDVQILGIAKGPDRRVGLERYFLNGSEISIDGAGDAGHLLQHIRDEAHRFAITGHRQRRQKARQQSELEGIDGVGPKRRKQLLTHFGGLPGVKGASVEELAKVPGISRKLAESIYGSLHQ